MTTARVQVQQVPVESPLFAQVADLFQAYRVHYGHGGDPERTRNWLADQLESGRLFAYLAAEDGQPESGAGVAILALSPGAMSLTVGWHVHDVYVDPAHRRRGVASALLDAIADDARAAGALRISLRTETDNHAALALYRRHGFTTSTGYENLLLELQPTPDEPRN